MHTPMMRVTPRAMTRRSDTKESKKWLLFIFRINDPQTDVLQKSSQHFATIFDGVKRFHCHIWALSERCAAAGC